MYFLDQAATHKAKTRNAKHLSGVKPDNLGLKQHKHVTWPGNADRPKLRSDFNPTEYLWNELEDQPYARPDHPRSVTELLAFCAIHTIPHDITV